MRQTTPPLTAQTPHAQPATDAAHCTAATLYLMSHYAQRPCPLLAHAIADQLQRLSRCCAGGTADLLQTLAATLLPHWQHIACGSAGAARH